LWLKRIVCLFLGYYFNIWRGAIDRSGGKNKVDSVAAILIKEVFVSWFFQKELEKSGRN
jgi:hypothetical protein